MHELHLAEDILNKIKERASQEKKSKLTKVVAALGEGRFTHLAELKELLDQIKAGTVAAEAEIELQIVPLQSTCAQCGAPFKADKLSLACPSCGSTDIKIISGQGLEILSVI